MSPAPSRKPRAPWPTTTQPAATQPAAWSDATTRWRAYDAMEWRLTGRISERMLDLAALGPGMALLDVGCGSGDTALLAAHRVGPAGRVVGLDVAAAMLELAAEKVARTNDHASGRAHITFSCADAAALVPAVPPFDVAIARWSLMCMTEPDEVLRRVRASLSRSGVLVAALWAEPERVEFASLWRRVLARHRDVPAPADATPSVFRFGSVHAFSLLFHTAGFVIERVEAHRVPVVECDTGADFVAWLLNFGGEPARLLAELPTATQAAFVVDLAHAAESFRVGSVISLGGVTRLIVARPA